MQCDSVSSQALLHPSPLASLLRVSPKLQQLITQTHSTWCNPERQMIQNLWNQKLMNKCLPFLSYTDNMEYTSQGFPKVPWNKMITSHSSQLKSTFFCFILIWSHINLSKLAFNSLSCPRQVCTYNSPVSFSWVAVISSLDFPSFSIHSALMMVAWDHIAESLLGDFISASG